MPVRQGPYYECDGCGRIVTDAVSHGYRLQGPGWLVCPKCARRYGKQPPVEDKPYNAHKRVRVTQTLNAACGLPVDYVVDLNARQMQMLQLADAGLMDKEIAERLCLSKRTVHWYMRQCRDILGAINRAGALYTARKLGLLE